MTKGELRKARKLARANGQPLTGGEPSPFDRREGPGQPIMEFLESQRGYQARERWARYYDSLNGAPEGDWDR